MLSIFKQSPIIADVEFDPDCKIWTVACERLGVYTEAQTYEALMERFWSIAPEMAQENHVPFTDQTKVEFRQTSQLAIAN